MIFRLSNALDSPTTREYAKTLKDHGFNVDLSSDVWEYIEVNSLEDLKKIEDILKPCWGIVIEFAKSKLTIYDGYLE